MKNQKSEDIKKALAEAIADGGQVDEIAVEKILRTLDKKKVLRYHRDHEISLLSTAGRVLVAIVEDPTMTVRAISVYLDLSETMIDKTVKQLIAAGLVSKTKVNRQNIYKVDIDAVLQQPDIQHISEVLKYFATNSNHGVADDEPW